jgi:hypothetical protein
LSLLSRCAGHACSCCPVASSFKYGLFRCRTPGFLLQTLAALREQLAAAQLRVQAAAGEAATLQQQLASERAAVADLRRQLEAAQ